MLNLKDAYKIMIEAGGDPSKIANKNELMDLIEDIDMAGAEAMKNVPDDDILTAATLMMSVTTVDLMTDGEFQLALILLSHRTAFLGVMSLSLKMAMGLKEIEGWK